MRLYLLARELKNGNLRPLDSRIAESERAARRRAEANGTVERDETVVVIAVAAICELEPETSSGSDRGGREAALRRAKQREHT